MNGEFIRTRILVPILSLAAVAILPACEGSGITDPAEPPEASAQTRTTFALVIEPAEFTLEAGETIQLQAFLKELETGIMHPMGDEVRWTSQAPKRATVDETGLVEAHEAGEVIILAAREDANPYPADQTAEARVMVR